MSSLLVKQSLALLDPDFKTNNAKQKIKQQKRVKDLIPESHKVYAEVKNEKGQFIKKNVLQSQKKLTVLEARRMQKSKEEILKENKEKLEKLRRICKLNLNKKMTRQIIERAVTRRPVKELQGKRKSKKTVFTEEDFKKFEEEYFNDDT